MNLLEFANSVLLTISETPLKAIVDTNAPIALKVLYAIEEGLSELISLGKWHWLRIRHTTILANWATDVYTLPYRLSSLSTVEYTFPYSLLVCVPYEQIHLVQHHSYYIYAVKDDNEIVVKPTPKTIDLDKFIITGYRIPSLPVIDTGVMDIPDIYLNALRYNVAAKLALRLHSDTQLFNSHMVEWERQLQTLRNRNSRKSNVYSNYGRKRGIQIN